MPILLKTTVFIAGALKGPPDGTLTYDAALEADLVHRKAAVYVGDNPAEGGVVAPSFATDASGNITGLLGPRGITLAINNIKDHGAIGDGVADDLPAFSSARTAAGSSGVVYFPGPATYFFAGSRPDLTGVNIRADAGVTIKVDENTNTKDMKLLTPVTVQNTVGAYTVVHSANTQLQAPELFNIAPGLYDLAVKEVSSVVDMTTLTHKVYAVATGDITTTNGTGTVTASQITWAADFSANPQVLYPASIEDGTLFELNATNAGGTVEQAGVFAKNATHVWVAKVQIGLAKLYVRQYDLTGVLISTTDLVLPNGGAYGWLASQEVNLGFVSNSGVVTVVLCGLPVYKFPATATAAGFLVDTAGDAVKVALKNLIKTTGYKPRVKMPLSIGVIGDSISWGAWSSLAMEDILPNFLQNMPWVGDVSVTNLAVSGTTSTYWATGTGASVDFTPYDIVLCMVGTNDQQGATALATYTTNLGLIASNITSDGAVPIFGIFPIYTQTSVSGVTGVTTTNYATHAKYTHALKKFCIDNGHKFADVRRAFGSNIAWYVDNIHPKTEGQMAIMGAWVEGICKYLDGRTYFN